MRILVFGAGPLGSLLAARLHQGGLDVCLLARGQRLADLQRYGIVIKSWSSGKEETVQVPLIEELRPEDPYDLILVVMRKNSALKILPLLAANSSPLIVFLMNNAAGPQALLDALGQERVLMGFAAAAGFRQVHKIVYINAEANQPAQIYVGETHGGSSQRLEKLKEILSQGRYLQVQIESNMDAWSKYHVGLLFPSLAPALFLCQNDHLRMARTRDALVLSWRAIHECLQVLKILGYPARPPILRILRFIPEPLGVALLKKILANPRMEVAMTRHAEVIRDEILQLNGEFLDLVDQSGLYTPTLRFLIAQFNQQAQPLPDGSRTIRLRWQGVLTLFLLLICAILALMLWL